jgi:hypothetical protein
LSGPALGPDAKLTPSRLHWRPLPAHTLS